MQIIFHKRATRYRSLLRKMTDKDKGSYESSPPCTCASQLSNVMIGNVYGVRSYTLHYAADHTRRADILLIPICVSVSLSISISLFRSLSVSPSLSLSSQLPIFDNIDPACLQQVTAQLKVVKVEQGKHVIQVCRV